MFCVLFFLYLGMLSVKPFKSILELLKAFPDEQSCIAHLEWLRWDGNVVSPFDESGKVYKCRGNKYKCAVTNKYFNVRTGTIFEGSKIPLQNWFVAIYLFTVSNKGISSYTLAAEMNVTQKTAWFMLQRIRYAMNHESFIRETEGVTQVDECFIGGRNKNRHVDKRVDYSKVKNRSYSDKTVVMGLIKNGIVKTQVIPDTTSKTLLGIIKKNVLKGALLVTDEYRPYKNLWMKYDHYMVHHNRGNYKTPEGFTTNSVEGFWSQVKKVVIGTYHNIISRKHMQRYMDECSFRYNQRTSTINDKFNVLLQNANGKRLTYQALIG